MKRSTSVFLRAILPLVIFIGFVALLMSGIGKNPRLIPSPLIGKPAPEFALPSLHDPQRIIRKQDLLGQYYLLNVWGSWCPSCRVEHPMVSEVARSGMIPVYGLNWKDDPANAKAWLQRFGDPYKDILVDQEGRTAINFGVYGAPESFVIDQKGIIRHKVVGEITPQVVQNELLPLIRKMEAGQ
jgi:cytochrome c biogenesis protein CcmG/thiol:disulfide interchange protein DsbE